MGRSTGTVRSITDDVLFISKVDSGEFNLIFSALSVDEVVHSAVQQSQSVASSRQVQVVVTLDPDIPLTLLGAGNRLHQVLTNLLSNC